ncbi:hypothetical protein REPUB_Repub01dG0224600 [Reevesia pubescens]
MASSSNRNEQVFTVFVNNLPQEANPSWVTTVFQRFGRVVDVFLPKNRSRWGRKFGFVRYISLTDAKMAIWNLNGAFFLENKIGVNMARFNPRSMFWKKMDFNNESVVCKNAFDNSLCRFTNERGQKSGSQRRPDLQALMDEGNTKIGVKQSQFGRPGFSFKDALLGPGMIEEKLTNSKHRYQHVQKCEGVLNSSCIHWLKCSAVVITKFEENIESLGKKLEKENLYFSMIKTIGNRLFLVTFANSDILCHLEDDDWSALRSWAFKCFKWTPSLSMFVRVAEVVLTGVPWHAWSLETTANILKDCGDVIEVETDVNKVDFLESMVVSIFTDKEQPLDGNMICMVDNLPFPVAFKELDKSSSTVKVIENERRQNPMDSQSATKEGGFFELGNEESHANLKMAAEIPRKSTFLHDKRIESQDGSINEGNRYVRIQNLSDESNHSRTATAFELVKINGQSKLGLQNGSIDSSDTNTEETQVPIGPIEDGEPIEGEKSDSNPTAPPGFEVLGPDLEFDDEVLKSSAQEFDIPAKPQHHISTVKSFRGSKKSKIRSFIRPSSSLSSLYRSSKMRKNKRRRNTRGDECSSVSTKVCVPLAVLLSRLAPNKEARVLKTSKEDKKKKRGVGLENVDYAAEAVKVWEVGKIIGLRAVNEEAVVKELTNLLREDKTREV